MSDEPRPFDAWDAGEHAYQSLTHLPPEQRVKAAVLAVHSHVLSSSLGDSTTTDGGQAGE